MQPLFQIKSRLKAVKASATLEINEHSRQLIRSGRSVIKFGFGQSPFPVPADVENALKAHAAQKDYLPVRGLAELRDAISGFIQRTRSIPCSHDQILVGPGSKELLWLVQLCFEGFLFLPSPSWVSYFPQALMTDNPTIWVETSLNTGWKILPEHLDAMFEKAGDKGKLFILNYPNNPTGVSYTSHELEQIAIVARKHQAIIVADEIYGLIHHLGNHDTIARYYPEGTILTTGLSKWCGAGGWRLGFVVFPEALSHVLQKVAMLASETFTSVSAPIQYAAITAFSPFAEAPRYISDSRKILYVLGKYVTSRLRQMKAHCVLPDGGFYVFPDFEYYSTQLTGKGIFTNTALCHHLIEDTGVALLPGVAFGRDPEEFTVRLSFVDFDGEKALENSSGLDPENPGSWLKQNAPRICTGMDRIEHWLQDLGEN